MTDNTLPIRSRFLRSDIRRNSAAVCMCIALGLSYGSTIADPKDDLGVTFLVDKSLPPPGGIAGTVTNKSAQRYDCVDLIFRLMYKDGSRGPAEQRVRVQHLVPRSVRNYSAPLQSKAGFGLQRIETCTSVSGKTPPTPTSPDRECAFEGSVISMTKFGGIGDRGRHEQITRVFLLTPDGNLVSEEPLANKTNHFSDHRNTKGYDSRGFNFARIPANHSYVVQLSNAWKTAPSKIMVHCPNAQGRYNFRIAPLRHTGNRLGG